MVLLNLFRIMVYPFDSMVSSNTGENRDGQRALLFPLFSHLCQNPGEAGTALLQRPEGLPWCGRGKVMCTYMMNKSRCDFSVGAAGMGSK